MRFLLRRTLFYMAAAAIAIVITFVIPRMMSGDPATIMFARAQGRIEPRALDALKETFGFVDGPLHEQFFAYLGSLLKADLGPSVTAFPTPVTQMIQNSLGWTLRLVGVSTIIAFSLGTLLGIFAAWRRGKFIDSFILPLFSILNAFPYFWIAMLAVFTLGFELGWFPKGHAFDTRTLNQDWSSLEFQLSVLQHAILPATVIVITAVGGWMLGMRNNMIGVLSQDYITMAEAKGLKDRRVMMTYAARNAILPSLTGFAMSLGFVIGGSLLTEIVFSYPGMGMLLLEAVEARDYPLMQGIFLIITLGVLLANLLADFIYVLLDPRAR
jgi:peptide/nickel transport system permease protein